MECLTGTAGLLISFFKMQKAIEETVDIFHRGKFCLVQPLRKGHRAGMDAMMLAAAVPAGFRGRLVDLGAGSGAAALAVLSRLPDVEVSLVEYSPLMLEFAEKTRLHPGNAHLRQRIKIIAADVSLRGQARSEAGLADNSFDFAIMNPPFNLASDQATPDAEKARAHVMEEGLFASWLRTAAAIVRPGGGIALIARPVALLEILNAMRGRFGALVITAILPRPKTQAIRIIISGKRGSRQALTLASPLVLHADQGHAFTPHAQAINNGLVSLWD